MTTIYRLNKSIIVVDGIKCKRNSYDGRYYPMRADLMNVSLFPDAIDSFLLCEEENNKERFEFQLIEALEEASIYVPYDEDDDCDDMDRIHLN